MPLVAPLREFVEHILRASNATYTTLLAALYYLQLLRSQSPQEGCTTEQSCGIASPLQCRRRMFLAALMLGWKYTQDRSYTSRGWAKVSGLCAREINFNEAIFLEAIHWALYIPQTAFDRWKSDVTSYISTTEAWSVPG